MDSNSQAGYMFNRHAWPKRRPAMVTDGDIALPVLTQQQAAAAAQGTVLDQTLCTPEPDQIAYPRAVAPKEF